MIHTIEKGCGLYEVAKRVATAVAHASHKLARHNMMPDYRVARVLVSRELYLNLSIFTSREPNNLILTVYDGPPDRMSLRDKLRCQGVVITEVDCLPRHSFMVVMEDTRE